MNAPIRDRHEWFTPLSRPGGISPDSPCPDACQDRKIKPRYFCVGCLAFHPQDEHWIDASKPPPPLDPIDRANSEIDRLKTVMGELDPDTDWYRIIAVRRLIADEEKILKQYARPTAYKPIPGLKGGKG